MIGLSSRPEATVTVAEKHAQFFAALADLPEPWGPGERPIPPAPDVERYNWAVSLTRYLGAGFSRYAHLSYAYRHDLQDKGSRDDQLALDIGTRKLDLHEFIYQILPRYIVAFDAYRLDCEIDPAYGPGRSECPGIGYNSRSEIIYVNPIQFWDAELLRRAFDLTPEQVAAKFEGQIEHVQLLRGGVYLVGSSQPLPGPEFRECAARMKQLF